MNWFEALFELFDGAWDIYKARRDGALLKEILLLIVLVIVCYFVALIK